MTDSIWKEYKYQVMAQDPEVECISLLSQVMGSYNTLSPAQKDAIAKWFGKNYEIEVMKREEIFVEGIDRPLFVDPDHCHKFGKAE